MDAVETESVKLNQDGGSFVTATPPCLAFPVLVTFRFLYVTCDLPGKPKPFLLFVQLSLPL